MLLETLDITRRRVGDGGGGLEEGCGWIESALEKRAQSGVEFVSKKY